MAQNKKRLTDFQANKQWEKIETLTYIREERDEIFAPITNAHGQKEITAAWSRVNDKCSAIGISYCIKGQKEFNIRDNKWSKWKSEALVRCSSYETLCLHIFSQQILSTSRRRRRNRCTPALEVMVNSPKRQVSSWTSSAATVRRSSV